MSAPRAAGPAEGAAVREFGTGLLSTVVTERPADGWTWNRRPGPLCPAPFAAADGEVGELIGRTGSSGEPGAVRWVVGAPDGEARVYHVRGPESAAGRLLREGPDEELVAALRGLGRALRELHDLPVPPTARLGGVSRGLARFTDWLAGRARSPRAAYAQSLLGPRLGDARIAALRAACERITDGSTEDRVLCHGAPSLGSLVPAVPGQGAPGEADMLVGEDLCLAPWYADLGWTLGELVELRWYRGDGHPGWPRMVDALFQGYGRDLGDDWSTPAALRVLLHLHDYTAYVGWDETVFDKYTGFAMFLLDL